MLFCEAMRIVTFPDGSTARAGDDDQFIMQCRGRAVRFMTSKLAIHAWAKANHPVCINDQRTILWIPTLEVIQVLKPGEKAYMPGRFR
jgi:hypothetical protein